MTKYYKHNQAIMEQENRKVKHGEESTSSQMHVRRGVKDMVGTGMVPSKKVRKVIGGKISKSF